MRSVIQCQPAWPMSTDDTMMPARSETTCENSRFAAGSAMARMINVPELEADVVGRERGDRMRARELQRLLQRDGKPRPCTRPKTKRDDPAVPQMLEPSPTPFSIATYTSDSAMSAPIVGANHVSDGARPNAASDERDRMRNGKRDERLHEIARAPDREAPATMTKSRWSRPSRNR